MSPGFVLALAYHAVGDGPAPLCLDAITFERHADILRRSGATALTATQLGEALMRSSLPERAVVITFDDGIAGVADVAAPLLERHGLVATVFCVSRYLGRDNAWPSQTPSTPRLALADTGELTELAERGWEIGAHGTAHEPLDRFTGDELRGELQSARSELESGLGVEVRAFAHPYGIVGAADGAALADAGYTTGWLTRPAWIDRHTEPLAVPRVDAHYVRSPRRLELLLGGRLPGYVSVRRWASSARRSVARRGPGIPVSGRRRS